MVKIGKGLNRCPDCQVPRDLCYCARIEKINNLVPVSIIMHQRERFLTSNTAVVAKRALENSEILLRGMREQSASEDLHIKDDHVPLVLYPAPGALNLGSTELKEYLNGRTPHLIVPDGSWRQAKRVAKREEALKNVQAVVLSDLAPSQYRLRRQVKPGRLCTFEAIARALGELESHEVEKKLMKTLAAMDHAHAMARGMDKFDDGNPDPLTQRLFVGVRVGKRPHRINSLQERFPQCDWVQTANDHITLLFLGRLRRSQKAIVIEALKKVRFSSFSFKFKTLGAFEEWETPSVIWVKPENTDELNKLQKQILSVIEPLGIPLPEREYIPHWTILRTRGHRLSTEEIAEFKTFKLEHQFDVKEFILFEGHAGKGIYEEVFKIDAK